MFKRVGNCRKVAVILPAISPSWSLILRHTKGEGNHMTNCTDKDLIVAKTILSCYPRIEEFKEYSKALVNKTALLSFYSLMSTEAIVGKILSKMKIKDVLAKLKQDIDDIMQETKRYETIRLHFFKQKTCFQIADMLDIHIRTVFRRLNREISDFSSQLPKLGIDSFSFRDLLKKHRWIRHEYERLQQEGS